MKGRLITVLYIILMVVSSGCTNPVQTPEIELEEVKEMPAEPRVPEITEQVLEEAEVVIEPEYVYTIIGTWRRDFDQHVEFYVFTEDMLTTYIDGQCNGSYNIEHLEDWTFILSDIGVVFDYELLHVEGVADALVVGGYVYRRV